MTVQRRHDPDERGFASDNYAGAHPEILAAIAVANGGHQVSYGADVYTERLQEVVRGHFGQSAHTYPVFNGTGANVVALQTMLDRWDAVVCAESAHINVDEGGAPEKVAGIKLLTVPAWDGKLTPELIDRQAWGFEDEHRARPRVVSIAQSTELGTCYTPDEIRAICDHAHGLGMLVYLDGARLANAAATLGVSLREMTTDAGVDVLSLGGTKNGLLFGEAVIVLNEDAVRGMAHLRKTSMQLGSKMRFMSVQFEALLGGDLWLRSAARSNAMTQRLYEAVRDLPGLEIPRPVQANQIFAVLPPAVTERLQKRFRFYTWDEQTGEVRWMTSFDTTEGDVDAFAAAIAEELAAERGQGPAGALTVAEREELVQLRRRVREMEEMIEALGQEPAKAAFSANRKTK
ncbi:low specificity L-threonine aldolase [Streptomyces paradoxus]|uniref:Threonine aldolase n=1 Tax=Streptomyces paradoxus TaxID=66375 RepID=A0A7W9T565_9ACTN|nr:low specificity L-threonine aldolase [Streptomyces paradoxus]MBB6074310.1 threonine aldolase [Streptomyces paradoxus]